MQRENTPWDPSYAPGMMTRGCNAPDHAVGVIGQADGPGDLTDPRVAHDTDFLLPELIRLLGTAAVEIDRHVGEQGACMVCGAKWPCDRAIQAAFALGWF